MVKLKVILIFILVWYGGSIISQEFKGFSGNIESFDEEVLVFFEKQTKGSVQKKDIKDFYENFQLFWNSGQLSVSLKKNVIELANLMYNKKMRPFPHFSTYFEAVYTFFNTRQKEEFFQPWHSTLTYILNNQRIQQFSEFIEFSKNFFENQYLYYSLNRSWKAESKNYKFYFDKEPIIEFPSLTLKYYANKDSSVIYNTAGTFYPFKNLWVGKYGKIDWQRAGFNPKLVYAEFDEYQIDIRNPSYTIENARLHHRELFGTQVLVGKIEEKVLANKSLENAIYPLFIPKESRLRINNIFPDLDYEGGITLKGARLMGSGDEKEDAYIYVRIKDTLFMKLGSKNYIIKKNSISSQKASVVIYLGIDSIYQPGRIFNYNHEDKQITIVRERHGLSKAPFYSTYHKLEMDFEALYWRIGDPRIELRMIIGPGAEGKADFISTDYFSMYDFQKIMGIDELHPLISLKDYSIKINSRAFSVSDYAKYRRLQEETIRNMIIDLASKGFIFYDPDNDMIYLKDKTFNYLAAASGKKDYDVIQFNSEITVQSNATLSLLDYSLKMRGISRIFVSDSQNVLVYPHHQEIIVKKNRDFVFSGRVQIGPFDYYGSNFLFEYDKFRIDMPLIDSMTLKVRRRTPDEYGFFPFVKVRSTIEDMQGHLLIDHPNNKAGLKPYPQYPIFTSERHSYVYYDKTSIFGNAYPRDIFYYKLDPFFLDSMKHLRTDDIFFEGYLESAGIFPSIREPLRVQDDYSLGFKKTSPQEGYPIYNGKATFLNEVTLNNRGLRGNGIIEYLTSTSHSKDFIFFPTSMVSDTVEKFIIEERKVEPEYPIVFGESLKMNFLPYSDSLIISTKFKDKPFKIFSEEANFLGTLKYTPRLLSGDGIVDYKGAEINSNNFKFFNRRIIADTCSFALKSYDLKELAFTSTKSLHGDINFDERTGIFTSYEGKSLIKFPINQYICYMDKFEWHMDADEISFSSTEQMQEGLDTLHLRELAEIEIQGPEFISIHPAQDSLSFVANKAKYNHKKNIIHAYFVRIIRVADAAIMPIDGEVTILKGAEIVPLKDAQILANTTTKYHFFTNANVSIYGKNKYKADGIYEYIDEFEESYQIYFKDITVDTTLQTVAVADISDTLDFAISPFFDFKGQIHLSANNELLNFKGATAIAHKCDTLPRRWMMFQSDIDPKNVMIPVSQEILDFEGNNIEAGLFFSADTIGIYSAFLEPKRKKTDIEIASSYGYLVYDKITNEYKISSKEKLAQLNLPGNFLSLDVNRCIVRAEGKLNFGANLGRIELTAYGNAIHFIEIDSTHIRANIELDFFFNEKSLEVMRRIIQDNTSLEGVPLNSELYLKYLGEVLGLEKADKVISEISLYGQIRKLPEELQHTISFLDVNLVFNNKTQSYISTGKIGIGIIGDKQINKYVNGIIEIELHKRGDKLTIYLEPSSSEWFFFHYANNLMQAFSSVKEFNDNIIETEAKHRQLETKGKEQPYSYYISNDKRKNTFLKKIELAYKNAEEPNVEVETD